MFSAPSEAAFFFPDLGNMGFWDQAIELRQSTSSPTHTITFKLFEYIRYVLSQFFPWLDSLVT